VPVLIEGGFESRKYGNFMVQADGSIHVVCGNKSIYIHRVCGSVFVAWIQLF